MRVCTSTFSAQGSTERDTRIQGVYETVQRNRLDNVTLDIFLANARYPLSMCGALKINHSLIRQSFTRNLIFHAYIARVLRLRDENCMLNQALAGAKSSYRASSIEISQQVYEMRGLQAGATLFSRANIRESLSEALFQSISSSCGGS